MTYKVKNILITAIVTFLLPAVLQAADTPNSLLNRSYTTAASIDVVPDDVVSYLQTKNTETAKIWVFFKDKGFNDKSGFDQKAASVTFSEKVSKRRAKVNLSEVTFVDLPVVKTYVDEITDLGATHRRSSRWLNAASFEVSYEQLADIETLPFVQSVRPIAGFKKEYPEEIILKSDIDNLPEQSLAPDALNYGSSLTQLSQINVPAVHAKGYTGAGVTLCLTDTGYRKSHEAFAQAYTENRVIAEYDFVFNDGNTANEAADWSSQWNHGTLIWSTSAGQMDGTTYGPAYGANILLAKTEDVRSETPLEEDNWVAALEWADSLGADVISTSLGYSDWYTLADYDGNTATITLAANTCASLGIVLCNSMGNSGSAPTTLSPPADAFDIVAVGAVNSSGTIASFSSRGPTADGRVKPEVCAMGVSTYSASSSGDASYTTSNGTSLSTPLVAGAACLLIEARPSFPPDLIRLALMETADNAATPDNDYGHGIIDVDAALGWGANVTATVTSGDAPLTVGFNSTSTLTITSYDWDFGDGSTSTSSHPSHMYTEPGVYDVSLTIDTEYGLITDTKSSFIFVYGDTMVFVSDSGFAGNQVAMSVNMTNSQPLSEIRVPFKLVDNAINFDSVSRGTRTANFEVLEAIAYDAFNDKYTYRVVADTATLVQPGSGEVMKIYFTIDSTELGGTAYLIDTSISPFLAEVTSPFVTYAPNIQTGYINATNVLRGDLTYDFAIDISDLVFMVNYSFGSGSAPMALQMFDVNYDLTMNVSDINYLVAYMFNGGPPPVSP